MRIWKQLKISCQRVANFVQAAMIILIQRSGEDGEAEAVEVIGTQVAPGLGAGRYLRAPSFSMAWVEMAWANSQDFWWSVGKGAGLEDSPLAPESTHPKPSCYPRAESRVLTGCPPPGLGQLPCF